MTSKLQRLRYQKYSLREVFPKERQEVLHADLYRILQSRVGHPVQLREPYFQQPLELFR